MDAARILQSIVNRAVFLLNIINKWLGRPMMGNATTAAAAATPNAAPSSGPATVAATTGRTQAALGALETVRQSLLKPGLDTHIQELRLASKLSCVSKHLDERTRSRCGALLSGTNGPPLTSTGPASLWEASVGHTLQRAAVAESLGWLDGGTPLSAWDRVTVLRVGHVALDLGAVLQGPLPPDSSCSDNVDDQCLEAIGRLGPALKDLKLYSCRNISAAGVESIAESCVGGLVTLNLNHCSDLTDSGLIALGRNCPGLTGVDIGWCEAITDRGVDALATGCPLEDLNLAYCGLVSDRSLVAIGAYCSGMQRLNVDLSYSKVVTDVGISALAACT